MLGQTNYFKIEFKFIASGIRIIMTSYAIPILCSSIRRPFKA